MSSQSHRRVRLVLGSRQVERLLLAISYAIDTYASVDDEDESGLGRYKQREIRHWHELHEVIRRARWRAERGGGA